MSIVLLYVVFCRLGLVRLRWLLLVALMALLPANEFIARGLIGFFIGGAVWFITERIKQRGDAVYR